ncbi:DNA polymerase IV [Novosphingobium pokkalii]|uniref:DNA polymerase IV n=1 Tax=Novosphingobium pokkalii TaxID=1770194 RepID=UPI003634DE4D
MASSPTAAAAEDAPGLRKIIHVDMDAFYASVEQRDAPELRGRPVAVGGSAARGVVAAASYEARAFGVRSAMPSARAVQLCPELIFRRPRFEVYRAVSQQICAIFLDYTPHVEPLSLDEAYLDVTRDLRGIGSATRIAELIRQRIRAETGLTASAGVSYNKFLAKLASDQNKPDGLCVIAPARGRVRGQPAGGAVSRVGPRGAEKMAGLGIATGADLRRLDLATLRQHFGAQADYLYRAARGIDLRAVMADRPRKSVGAERTFDRDLSSGSVLRETLETIIDLAWDRIARADASGRTVTLKLKFRDFSAMSRARSVAAPIATRVALAEVARGLLDQVLPLPQPVRLMGVTLSALDEPGQDADAGATAPGQAQLPF